MISTGYDHVGLRYLRVAITLKQRILDGTIQPGDRLPPQHDLARELGVSFTTIKRALDILGAEGYVVRKVGNGTYASLPADETPTALVVDDDASIRKLLARMLSEQGWRAVEAESGQEAAQKFGDQQTDLVLLDLVMPGMSGLETFREIRKQNPEAYVVIVTAYPDSVVMAEALDIGPFAVIKKPFNRDGLRTILRRASRTVEKESGPNEQVAALLGAGRERVGSR